jgi:hypothetical protein
MRLGTLANKTLEFGRSCCVLLSHLRSKSFHARFFPILLHSPRVILDHLSTLYAIQPRHELMCPLTPDFSLCAVVTSRFLGVASAMACTRATAQDLRRRGARCAMPLALGSRCIVYVRNGNLRRECCHCHDITGGLRWVSSFLRPDRLAEVKVAESA